MNQAVDATLQHFRNQRGETISVGSAPSITGTLVEVRDSMNRLPQGVKSTRRGALSALGKHGSARLAIERTDGKVAVVALSRHK